MAFGVLGLLCAHCHLHCLFGAALLQYCELVIKEGCENMSDSNRGPSTFERNKVPAPRLRLLPSCEVCMNCICYDSPYSLCVVVIPNFQYS